MKLRGLFLLLFLAAGTACAYPPPYEAAKSVSVRLEKDVENGTMICSGYVRFHHVIATDEHCIEDGITGFRMNGRNARVLQVVKDGNDHVLLLTDLYWEHVATMGPRPKQGDSVFTQANPDGQPDILLTGKVAGFRDAYVYPNWGLFHDLMLIDSNDTQGCSGGAIFDAKGRVVGEVSALWPWPNDGWKLAASFGDRFTKEQINDMGRASTMMDFAHDLAELQRALEQAVHQ